MCSFGKKLFAAGLAGISLVSLVPIAALAADNEEVADHQIIWAPAPSSVVNPSPNTDLNGWAVYEGRFTTPSVDEHLDDPVLKGAIDIHAHFGPDTYDRQWDAFEIAKLAQERGLRGAVFKNHWTESAGVAYLVRKYANAPGFEAYGSLSLNATVGGINPQAVRYFAEVEGRFAKVVWMPTHDSEHEVKEIKEARPYVIVSKDGVLLPEVLEVLDLISEYKLTLATGHVNAEEMVQIVAEAKKRGVERIILTHPNMGPMFTDPTIEQLNKATAMGAYAEIVTSELTGRTSTEFINVIRTLGAEHCIISSDRGLIGSRNHADALVLAARILREEGFSEEDLNLMFKANPAKVLGLPVL
jgi:predicted TIM-barrel fold metal-dependent hydrolase